MSKYIKIFSICFIVFSLSIKAQKYDATLYFSNGTKKEGKTDAVINGEPKLGFIENGQSKKEKIKVENLEKVEYHNENKESVIVERKEFLYYMGDRKPKSDYNWMIKIHSGEVSVYTSSGFDPGVSFNMQYRITPTTVRDYFFQYKNEKPELIYFISSDLVLNKKKVISNFIKHFFEEICPNLVTNYNNNKIRFKDNPMPLVTFYEKNCSTTN
jgi:hypothetical protein